MTLSPIYYARVDNGTAANDAVNVFGSTIYTIQFTAPTWQQLALNQVPDGPDPGTTYDFDPDTQIIINGITYNFALMKTGTLPVSSVPPALQGDLVYVIKIDYDRDGDLEGKGDLQLFFTISPDGTATNMAAIGNGALTLGNVVQNPPPGPVCFCTGTMIATPSGQRAVETLVAGDMVLNDLGEAHQIMWIGRSRIGLAALRSNSDMNPVRIPANAFGPSLPKADLLVSPQHRIVLDGPAAELLFGAARVLAAAKHLVGTFAEAVTSDVDVDYFHILTEAHEILLANGLPTESFQPARRMIDVMTPETRALLEQTLEVLGRDDMLSRQDAMMSLKSHEARTLAAMMQGPQLQQDAAVLASVALTA